MRPPFIRVLPPDVERYGPHAAILLAHIRFRCKSDGPGRFTAEGARWWRVSQVDMADETGLSVQGVKTALKALGNVVLARHFKPLSNQSRAYRVTTANTDAELPEFDFNQWTDLPEVEINHSQIEINHCSNGNQPLQQLKSTSVLPIEKLEKGKKAALTRARTEPACNGSPQLTHPNGISIEPPQCRPPR